MTSNPIIRGLRDGLGRMLSSDRLRGPQPRPVLSPGIHIARAGRSSFHPLVYGTQTIGGGPECDLVVLAIGPNSLFRLNLREGHGAATVEALCDGLAVGNRRLADGEKITLLPSVPLRFADITFEVQGLPSASPVSRFIASRSAVAASLFALAGLALLFGLQIDRKAPPLASAAALQAREQPPTAETVATQLREAIRLARLPIDIPVVLRGREIQVGEGAPALMLADRTRLESIINAIGQRSPVPVVNMTQLASGLSGFVAAAGYEPMSFIIGKDGRHYRKGDKLGSGWLITEIRPGRLTVARGKEIDVVRFGQGTPAADAAPMFRSEN